MQLPVHPYLQLVDNSLGKKCIRATVASPMDVEYLHSSSTNTHSPWRTKSLPDQFGAENPVLPGSPNIGFIEVVRFETTCNPWWIPYRVLRSITIIIFFYTEQFVHVPPQDVMGWITLEKLFLVENRKKQKHHLNIY